MSKINIEIPYIENLPLSWKFIPNRFLFLENKNKVGDNFSNYQLLSLTTSGVKEKDINSTGGKVPESYENYLAIKKNQMVFCLFDLDVSAVFSGISRFDGMITSAYNAYESTSLINNDYADYWFQYVFTNRYYMMYSKNIRYSVTGQAFKSIYTPVPLIDVQNKIVSILHNKTRKIDQLIQNQQQQIEKLKEYKQSLISEGVTKGLDSKVEFRDSGVEWIGKIPKHWDLIRVKDLSTNTTLRNNNPNLQYIALENIESQSYRFIDTDNEYDPNEGILAPRYSVLFGKLRPYLAKSFYCENDVSCSSEFAVFPFENEITSKYFLLLTQSFGFIDTINMSTYGTKMPRANINYINNLSVQLPPYDEQKLIVDFVMHRISIIEKILSIKNLKVKELEDYKKSLIYEYVTGKKEVS